MLLPTAVCEKKKTSNPLLKKGDLERLGLSSLGQQAGVAFQQAGVTFRQAGVAFQQAGIAFQHLPAKPGESVSMQSGSQQN